MAQQQTKHVYKVIVVDNASTDRTAAVAREWQNRLKLQLISEPRKGRGSARRRGFAEVKTEIILSTDADSVVPPDWIEALVGELLAHPNVAAVSGSSYITDGTRITNLTMRIGMPLSLRLYRLLVGHYMLTGANFAIRRAAYEAASGFNASRDMLDDVDLAFRVHKIGRIVYMKRPKVETEGDRFAHGFVRSFWHYAQHLPSLLKLYWFGGISGKREPFA